MQDALNELWVAKGELQGARDELHKKIELLDRARCEASAAESSIGRLTDECKAL